MKSYLYVLTLIVSAVALRTAQGQTPEPASSELGVHEGSITLFEAPDRPIPLAFSISLSGEVIEDQSGNTEGVLDSSFVIDGEGGPFIFTKLTIDDFDGRLDFRYSRPAELGGVVPAAFRLVGYMNDNNEISGKVMSGSLGYIGDFSARKVERKYLRLTPKYEGTWRGMAETKSGALVPVSIELANGLNDTTNPGASEFEFTPAKVASLTWNNLRLSMDHVVIDYLRRRVTLSKSDDNGFTHGLVVEFVIDFDQQSARGFINSAQQGRVASFVLPLNDKTESESESVTEQDDGRAL